MTIIQLSDFVGFHAIARTPAKDVVLQAYIDRYEKEYIYKLLGKTLGDLFIADLTAGEPQTAIYEAIFEEFTELHGTETYRSLGMKQMLLSFVYYHYVAQTQGVHTQSGVTTGRADAGTVNGYDNAARLGERKYNEAIDTFEAIQLYINDNLSSYPTFVAGEVQPKLSWLL